MKLRFTLQATQDLVEIADYIPYGKPDRCRARSRRNFGKTSGSDVFPTHGQAAKRQGRAQARHKAVRLCRILLD